MKDLSFRKVVTVASLPAAAPALAGVIAMLSTDSNAYWCNGTAWVSLSAGGSGTSVIKQVTSGTIAAISAASTIPYDNTAPLIGEGSQVWTTNFTPTNINSHVSISASFAAQATTNSKVLIVAVFRDSTCVGVTTAFLRDANQTSPVSINFTDLPATTSQVVYSCRMGTATAATWKVNQESVAKFNGLMGINGYTITEW